jgi:IMP cyclohydrolase
LACRLAVGSTPRLSNPSAEIAYAWTGSKLMYIGRIVGIGRTDSGCLGVAYRVSSRSFPNRVAERKGDAIWIVPKPGSPDAASPNPYISYECLVWNERYIVGTNGSHTRPIFERLLAGYDVRDVVAGVLAGLDREFDGRDTPRLCAIVDLSHSESFLGSVTKNSLAVVPVHLRPAQFAFISTNEYPLVTGR